MECLELNLSCPQIDEVCLLVEGSADSLPSSSRLTTRQITRRPAYQDFFNWINEIAGSGDLSAIANADIWFDGSIAAAARALEPGVSFALARWDGLRLFDRNDSQDTWIFRGQVSGVRGDFSVGLPRCDNRLLYELEQSGYHVRNPAFSIITHHLHSGARGEYADGNTGDFVPPPYRYLWPHNLWSLPETWVHNLRFPGERVGWRYDRRRAARTLPARAISKAWRVATHRRDSSIHGIDP